MKKLIPLFFLLIFFTNQLHLIEVVASIGCKGKTTETQTEKSPAENEASDDESKGKEKDADEKYYQPSPDFIVLAPYFISSDFGLQTLFHAHPFHEDDIKPPEFNS